jgi:hypothetical protein
MKDELSYEDFDLLIEPGVRGSYKARVLRSPAGESASVQFKLPFTKRDLDYLVLKVSQGRRRTRGSGRPESEPLKEFGGELYGAVFQGELRDVLLRSLSQTRTRHVGMRLRLRLADVPKLAELPWEFLYDTRLNRFLAQSRRTPLVRYLDLPDPPQPLSVEGPLRLLVMISSPGDYAALDAEQEWSLLTGALARQQTEGQVIIEQLAANMSMLRQRLRRDEFHVFHFIGHGRYRSDWGSGVLVMEDRNGRPQEVTGEELGGLLTEYDQTRLAVLNACEGARSDASDPFAGVAQSLIQQGLPAVVAMQFEITDDAAIIFAREFYGAISDGYPLEASLAEARGAIRDEGNPTEWGTPVLYSRAPDGRVFNLTSDAGVRGVREAPEKPLIQAELSYPAGKAASAAGRTHDTLYSQPISTNNPGCIVFLLDRSHSMGQSCDGAETLAQIAARTINGVLLDLCVRAQVRPGVIRHYFDIGIFGYGIRPIAGGEGAESAFGGVLQGRVLVSLPDTRNNPVGVEEIASPARGLPPMRVPIWVKPAHGHGRPMCQAIALAGQHIFDWAQVHPESFPPIIINITNGLVTDDPYDGATLVEWTGRLTSITTRNGAALFFNDFLSCESASVMFPTADSEMPAPGPDLFRISSVLPPSMVEGARAAGYTPLPGGLSETLRRKLSRMSI